eukprot:scaffold64084_cov63-Phaeocystis_antarctica.AAC.1
MRVLAWTFQGDAERRRAVRALHNARRQHVRSKAVVLSTLDLQKQGVCLRISYKAVIGVGSMIRLKGTGRPPPYALTLHTPYH